MSAELPALPVNVRRLPKTGHFEKFEADEEARSAIARSNDLESVETFKAEARVSPWKREGVKIEGRVMSSYTQACAVTGEPLALETDELFEIIFVPEGSRLAKPRTDDDGELIVDPEGDDPPDTFTGDAIDLMPVWQEFFTLSLDPFARAEGAELPAEQAPDDDQPSPFAVLADWKKK